MSTFAFLRAVLSAGLVFLLSPGARAQQNVGIGTTAPHAKAALEIAASDKGLLIPRLDSVQRTAISSPPQGLLVYQTNGRAGLWYFQGSWQFLKAGNQADNLGNHTATRNLNLGTSQLVGNGGSSGVAISGTGAVRVPQLAGTGPGRLMTLADDGTLLALPPPFRSAANGNPQQPTVVGTAVNTGREPITVAVNAAGTRAYVVNRASNTLQAYDVSNPAAAPVAVGAAAPTGNSPWSVAVNPAGTRAYVVNYSGNTLQAYDISNPAAAPVAVGAAVPTGNSPWSVAVNPAGTRAYVVNSISNTLQAYDISDPAAAPVAVGAAVPTGVTPFSVTVNTAGTRAYLVNNGSNTLQAYDISSTAGVPVAVGAPVATGSGPACVAVNVAGTRAYVVNLNSNTLQAYDISSPAGVPVAVGAPAVTGISPYIVTVNAVGTRAYVVNVNSNTLQAYDISSPTGAPVAVGAPVATDANPTGLAVNAVGTRAYVVNINVNTLQAYAIGGAPLLLAQGTDGALGSVDPALLGDNLGNHTATQNLNLNGNRLSGGTTTNVGIAAGHTLELGAGVAGKEANAGKIGYQTFTADALDIVGAGTTVASRKVKVWAEGGTAFNGNVGIGTNSPSTSLDVDGGLVVRANSTILITADNFNVPVGNRSYLRLGSNSTTPTARSITLGNGLQIGQLLYISNGSNQLTGIGAVTGGAFNMGDFGNLNLAANPRTLGPADMLTLMWDGAQWIEVSFSNN